MYLVNNNSLNMRLSLVSWSMNGKLVINTNLCIALSITICNVYSFGGEHFYNLEVMIRSIFFSDCGLVVKELSLVQIKYHLTF